MMSYEPFWKTLSKSGETTYTMIHKHKFPSSTIQRMRDQKSLRLSSVEDICRILNCRVEDVVEYIPDEKEPNKEM